MENVNSILCFGTVFLLFTRTHLEPRKFLGDVDSGGGGEESQNWHVGDYANFQ